MHILRKDVFRVFLTYLLCKTFKYYYFWIILTFSKRKLPIFEPIQSIWIRNTYMNGALVETEPGLVRYVYTTLECKLSLISRCFFSDLPLMWNQAFFSGCWMPLMTFLNTEQRKYLFVSTIYVVVMKNFRSTFQLKYGLRYTARPLTAPSSGLWFLGFGSDICIVWTKRLY